MFFYWAAKTEGVPIFFGFGILKSSSNDFFNVCWKIKLFVDFSSDSRLSDFSMKSPILAVNLLTGALYFLVGALWNRKPIHAVQCLLFFSRVIFLKYASTVYDNLGQVNTNIERFAKCLPFNELFRYCETEKFSKKNCNTSCMFSDTRFFQKYQNGQLPNFFDTVRLWDKRLSLSFECQFWAILSLLALSRTLVIYVFTAAFSLFSQAFFFRPSKFQKVNRRLVSCL